MLSKDNNYVLNVSMWSFLTPTVNSVNSIVLSTFTF